MAISLKVSSGYVIDEPVVEYEDVGICQEDVELLTEALKQCYSNDIPLQNYQAKMEPRGKLLITITQLDTA